MSKGRDYPFHVVVLLVGVASLFALFGIYSTIEMRDGAGTRFAEGDDYPLARCTDHFRACDLSCDDELTLRGERSCFSACLSEYKECEPHNG